MKRFTMPPQPDVCLDDVKNAMTTFARMHGYVEEAAHSELKGVVRTVNKIRVVASSAKKATPRKTKVAVA